MIVTSVTVRVPAKINLQLAVGPLRPDGYHGLVTVFHAVSLFDDVTVAPAETDSVTVSGEGAGLVPEDGDNLALRAVRALRETLAERAGLWCGGCCGCSPERGGVAVTIAKRIPGGRRNGRRQRRRRRRTGGLQRAMGHRPVASRSSARWPASVGSDVAFAVLGETARSAKAAANS